MPLELAAGTKTTTYTYNGDGAVTSMTVEQSTGEATSYFTWDNFTPDETNPESGTLSLGNGTLVAIGSTPGAERQFTFDARDLLTAYAQPIQEAQQIYSYHADSILAEAELGGDSLSFYYDGGAVRRVVNQKQKATGDMSGRLGAGRYLSGGTEQTLLVPRKDTAALYMPSSDTLTAYDYTPFGASVSEPTVGRDRYDLSENPFQFAEEYRDPVWGGYYMRARWYHPDLPGFISRDPAQNLNRYGYGGANPIVHLDPGGKDFFHSVGNFLQHSIYRGLNKGIGGGFARFFLAPIMGPLAILNNPQGFWYAIEHNTANIDVFLALGVVSEVAGGIADYYATQDVVSWSRPRRYGLRTASDLVVGGGQIVSAGFQRGIHHFNWKVFGQGMEMTAGVNLFWRGLYGANVRSGFQGSRASTEVINDFYTTANNGDALVFRARTRVPGNAFLNNLPVIKDAPLLETFGLGAYHEKLIAVFYVDTPTNQSATVLETEFEEGGLRRTMTNGPRIQGLLHFQTIQQQAELVGRMNNFQAAAFFSNPVGGPLSIGDPYGAVFAPGQGNGYTWYYNNCHAHAYYVLKGMGLR